MDRKVLRLRVYLSKKVYLSLSVSCALSLSLSLRVCVCLSLSIYLSIHLSIDLSIYLSIHPSIHLLSDHLCIHLVLIFPTLILKHRHKMLGKCQPFAAGKFYLDHLRSLEFHFQTINVLLVKIEGSVWYTIYHQLPIVKGVKQTPSINQPTIGKRTSMLSKWIQELIYWMIYLVAHPTNRKWGPQPWWFQWDKWGQCPLITGVN